MSWPSRSILPVCLLLTAGCTTDQVNRPGYENPGCPVTRQAWTAANESLSDAAWNLLIRQSCVDSVQGNNLRVRWPGQPGLGTLFEELQEFAGKNGLATELQWFTAEEMVPQGAVPLGGLDARELDGIRLPVLRVSLPGPVASPRILFVTSIESLEDSPRETIENRRLQPSPSVDLSASGGAAILAALANVARSSIPPPSSIDVLLFSGELGFRGWGGLTFHPYQNRIGPAAWSDYEFAVGVQSVAGCSLVIRRPPSLLDSAASRELFSRLADRGGNLGLSFNETPLPGRQRGLRDFGGDPHPAIRLAWSGVPTALVAGGWWANETQAGLLTDDVAHACRGSVGRVAELMYEIMMNPRALVSPRERSAGGSQ